MRRAHERCRDRQEGTTRVPTGLSTSSWSLPISIQQHPQQRNHAPASAHRARSSEAGGSTTHCAGGEPARACDGPSGFPRITPPSRLRFCCRAHRPRRTGLLGPGEGVHSAAPTRPGRQLSTPGSPIARSRESLICARCADRAGNISAACQQKCLCKQKKLLRLRRAAGGSVVESTKKHQHSSVTALFSRSGGWGCKSAGAAGWEAERRRRS
jgi:hypothetical protein